MHRGIVVINKERGFTSFDVVAKLRGIFGQKKIGHTGTLDPDATGVLPVCLGNATKVCELLTGADKEYEAEMMLGVTTDTQDLWGRVLRRRDPSGITGEEVRRASCRFRGTILQTPPMYSALKINGKKLCDLARAGIEVERKPRPVTVYEFEILRMQLPVIRIRVRCSKGTYIRTLCHDLGELLGCGAALTSLVRTRSACFDLSQALTLQELEEKKREGTLGEAVRPVDQVFRSCPALMTLPEADRLLLNGARLSMESCRRMNGEKLFMESCCRMNEEKRSMEACRQCPEEEKEQGSLRVDPSWRRLYDSEGNFRAIYTLDGDTGTCRPLKMFPDR